MYLKTIPKLNKPFKVVPPDHFTAIKVGEPRPVTVMTSTTGKPDAPCKVQVTNPRGQKKEVPTKKIPEGYIATVTPEEVGPHKVDVHFNNKEIPKSPFNVMAEPAIDWNKVAVSGLQERKFKHKNTIHFLRF